MILLGISIYMTAPPSSVYWLDFAQFMGYQQIEFGYGDVPAIQNLEKAVIDSVGSFSIHAPYEWNEGYGLSTPASISLAPDEFVQAINKLTHQIPIASVVIHPPEKGTRDSDELLQRIDQLIPLPRLENIFPPGGHSSLQEFAEFFTYVNQSTRREIGFTFDIPHAYISDGTQFLDLPLALKEKLMGEEGYIHVSDCTLTKDEHKPLGEGEIPWRQVFDFLQTIAYEGTIVVELPSPPRPSDPELLAKGLATSYRELLSIYSNSIRQQLQQAWYRKQPALEKRLALIRKLPH